MARSTLPFGLALLLPHVLMCLLLIVLFYRRIAVLAFWRRTA